jgi:hypothetical protein
MYQEMVNNMGYDIISAKSKKDIEHDNELSHIVCQYAYQLVFKIAFGRDILEWNGRLTKKNKSELIHGIDKLILMLNDDLGVPVYPGNISNCSQMKLKKDFEELKDLVAAGKIGYIKIT